MDMRGKVLLRLRNITELQSLLESCMTGQPARLAQSVEHGTLNPRVVGSSPTSGARFYFYFFSSATPSFVPPLVTTEEVKTPVRHRRGKRLG